MIMHWKHYKTKIGHIRSFSNPNEISTLRQLSENLHICKEYFNSIYHNIAGCFQKYLIRLTDLFIEKMEDDIQQDPAEIFKVFDSFLINSVDFLLLKNLLLFLKDLFHLLLKLMIFSHRLSYLNFLIKLMLMV